MTLANEIKKRADAEGLSYWDYIKKHQGPLKLFGNGIRYTRVTHSEKELKRLERKRKRGVKENDNKRQPDNSS